MTGKDSNWEDTQCDMSSENFPVVPFGISTHADSLKYPLDTIDNTSYSRRKWEEERSKIFRHKLQEGSNLWKQTEKNSLRCDRKSSNISAIDKLQNVDKYSSSCGIDPIQKK